MILVNVSIVVKKNEFVGDVGFICLLKFISLSFYSSMSMLGVTTAALGFWFSVQQGFKGSS